MTKSPRVHLLKESPGSPAAEYSDLVSRAADGDHRSMENLLVRAQETAYRFSLLVCGHVEDAEDVMQDALLKTYQHVRRIRQPGAFRTWLYSTVRNACLMKRRLRSGEPRHLLPLQGADEGERDGPQAPSPIDVKDPGKSPDDLMMDAWIGTRLRHALATLAPGHRMILVLREMEGLSTREVAEVTGISEANVKTRLHRARLQLRRALERS